MSAARLESRLNCTRCGAFTPYELESDTVARCETCGKRHSVDSLFVVDPDKSYERDEAGTLQETPP